MWIANYRHLLYVSMQQVRVKLLSGPTDTSEIGDIIEVYMSLRTVGGTVHGGSGQLDLVRCKRPGSHF